MYQAWEKHFAGKDTIFSKERPGPGDDRAAFCLNRDDLDDGMTRMAPAGIGKLVYVSTASGPSRFRCLHRDDLDGGMTRMAPAGMVMHVHVSTASRPSGPSRSRCLHRDDLDEGMTRMTPADIGKLVHVSAVSRPSPPPTVYAVVQAVYTGGQAPIRVIQVRTMRRQKRKSP